MRLFLSSYRAQGHEEDLKQFTAAVKEMLIITNAKDDRASDERKIKTQEVVDYFKNLDYKPEELDLRRYFNNPTGLKEQISKYKFIWFNGGNTFLLARALKYSGANKILRDLALNDSIILGGESAGSIIMTPDLHGTENGDDPNIVPAGYRPEVVWEGLALVDFYVAPHYRSDWFGAEAAAMVNYFEDKNMPYKAITDHQAILVDGGKAKVLK